MLDKHQEPECKDCGKSMTFIDYICYKRCLQCVPKEEREQFAKIVDERNTLSDSDESYSSVQDREQDDRDPDNGDNSLETLTIDV